MIEYLEGDFMKDEERLQIKDKVENECSKYDRYSEVEKELQELENDEKIIRYFTLKQEFKNLKKYKKRIDKEELIIRELRSYIHSSNCNHKIWLFDREYVYKPGGTELVGREYICLECGQIYTCGEAYQPFEDRNNILSNNGEPLRNARELHFKYLRMLYDSDEESALNEIVKECQNSKQKTFTL